MGKQVRYLEGQSCSWYIYFSLCTTLLMLLIRNRGLGFAGQLSPVGPCAPCSRAGSRCCASMVDTNSATYAEGES